MTIHVRDEDADRLIRELAQRRGVSITEAIKLAARTALNEPDSFIAEGAGASIDSMLNRWDRLPRTPETSTKEFSDALWGEHNDSRGSD